MQQELIVGRRPLVLAGRQNGGPGTWGFLKIPRSHRTALSRGKWRKSFSRQGKHTNLMPLGTLPVYSITPCGTKSYKMWRGSEGTGVPRFPVPGSRFPVPRFWELCTTAYAHAAMQKPSNSSQNRSKRRRFPSKRDQKGAHFVMPILTFGGGTPSGASARADLGFRKVKKRVFGGPKCRVQKLSTKCGKL